MIKLHKNLIESDSLANIADIYKDSINYIYETLNKGEELNHFYRKKLEADNLLNYLIQWRILSKIKITNLLNDEFINVIKNHFNDDFLIFNMVFTRLGFPTKSRTDEIFGDLHYDNYENMNTLSTWIPLHDINSQTGGLLFAFDKKDEIKLNEKYFKNSNLSYTSSNSYKFYKISCNKCDVVSFNKNCLHGSIAPKSQSRMSIDLRFISKKEYEINKELFNESYINDRNILRPFKFSNYDDINNDVNSMAKNEFTRLLKLIK